MGQHSSKKYDVAPAAAEPHSRHAPAEVQFVDYSAESENVTPAPAPAPAPATASEPDTRVVPDWINESHFVEILKESVPQFSQIKSFRVKPGLSTGENYATLILRVSIDAELTDKTVKPISFMMKVPSGPGEMQSILEEANSFTTENEAYINVLPKFEELYKAKGLDVTFAPRAYLFKEGVKTEPKLKNTVLMHDLGQDGYKNLNRLEGLNFEQTKFFLRKLAQYHAASAVYKTLHGPYEKLMAAMLSMDPVKVRAMMESMFGPAQKVFLDNLKNYKDCEQYYEKLENNFKGILDTFFSISIPNANEFNVLNHGDCWINNLLFKTTSSGDIIDMIFVDFQGPRYAHPATDLLYFIMTSVHIDHKLKHFDFFIKYYHDNLTEHLRLLDYTERIPRLSELHVNLYKFSTFAVVASYMVLPVVLLDPTNTATAENFFGNTEAAAKFKSEMYKNKRYKLYIEQILPWLDNRGFLDAFEAPEGPSPVQQQVDKDKSVHSEVDSLVPAWVNSDSFKDLLVAEKPDFKEIQKFAVKKATEAGDNYSSIMLSVDVNYLTISGQSSDLSFMLKVAPTNAQSKALLDLMLTFKKEITMYNDVIPQLEQIYQQAGHPVIFGPKNYTFQKAPDCDYILLENMRPAGYKNADRLKGLSQSETEHVLAKLAKLHAASALLYVTKGTYDDVLDKPLHCERTRPLFDNPQSKLFMELSFEPAKTFKGGEDYADKVTYIAENFFDLVAKSEEYDESRFNCINHGDCWTNNILFAYDAQGEVQDVLLIDYQRSSFSSPAQDLYYLLLSSPNYDNKIEKFDYFVRYYHEELQRNLQLLKYPRTIPTLKDLHTDLLNNSMYAVTTTSTVMAIVLLDPTENASIQTMLEDSEKGRNFKKQLFYNERYLKHAQMVYPWLNHRGLLEYAL